MNQLYKTLQLIFLRELPQLSDICYYPSLNQYLPKLRKVVDETDITFKKDFKMLKNEVTAILLYIIQTSNNIDILLLAYKVLTLHIYGILMRKFIRFCDKTRLRMALDKLHGKHLFKRMGIEKALLYTAERIYRRYEKTRSEEEVIKMFLELRTALAQMIRALAKRYYALTPEDIKQHEEQLNRKLAPIIVKSIQHQSFPQCLQYAVTNVSSINVQDVVYCIKQLQSNSVQLQDFFILLLSGVTKKTQLCSVLWQKSRLKLISNKSSLYTYLHDIFKHNNINLYIALTKYYLCVIKQLFC